MRRNSHIFFRGFIVCAVVSGCALPLLWPHLTGKNKDYDAGGLIFLVCLLVIANLGLLSAALWSRRREAGAKIEQPAPAGAPGPQMRDPRAFVQLDFRHTFPHSIYVSSVSYDSEAPDGFIYKLFVLRREPEQNVEILLLRQAVNGPRRQVLHMQGPAARLEDIPPLLEQIACDKNVEFERFDLTDVRTFEEFRARALQVGWEAAHAE